MLSYTHHGPSKSHLGSSFKQVSKCSLKLSQNSWFNRKNKRLLSSSSKHISKKVLNHSTWKVCFRLPECMFSKLAFDKKNNYPVNGFVKQLEKLVTYPCMILQGLMWIVSQVVNLTSAVDRSWKDTLHTFVGFFVGFFWKNGWQEASTVLQ